MGLMPGEHDWMERVGMQIPGAGGMPAPITPNLGGGFMDRMNSRLNEWIAPAGDGAALGLTPEQIAASQSAARRQFAMGLLANVGTGRPITAGLAQGLQGAQESYRGAQDQAFRNTLIKRQEDRASAQEKRLEAQSKREEKATDTTNRQNYAVTASRIAAGLGGAQDKAAYWQMVSGIPEVQETLKSYGIDPAAVTPDMLPKIQQQLGTVGQVSGPGSPVLTPTDDIREYTFAQTQGYEGTFSDYMRDMKRAGATTVNLGSQGLSTPPSGYFRPDPKKPGLVEEPGGPVQTERNKSTGENRTAAGYLKRMSHAEQILGQSVPSLTDFTLAGTLLAGNAAMSAGANKLMSKEGQSYYQAASDWVRAKLRKESGAVISKEEMLAEIRTYFPIPGDSPQVVAQKAQARQIAQQAMLEQAGPAAAPMASGATGGWDEGWSIEPAK